MANRGKLSPLERCLRVFTDVRPGEGGLALMMFANVFLILTAYYFIKPLREGWISVSLIAGLEKMEVRAYTSFGQALLLVPIIAWYSRLVNRWPRGRVVTAATLFCISNLVLFWFLQPNFFVPNLPFTGMLFYLWVGMFGVFVVAQFWAFAADLYSDEEGRRMMPMIAIGATAGAAFGAKITAFLVEPEGLASLFVAWGLEPLAEFARQTLRTESLLLLACIPLGASILLTRIVDRRRGGGTDPAARPESDSAGGLSLVLGNRFLLGVAVVTLILNWVNTNGENLLYRVVQETLTQRAEAAGIVGAKAVQDFTFAGTTGFYGDFYTWVNVVALLLQAVIASRLLKYGGFATILLMLPVVALTSYATMALVPVLAVLKVMKVAENATDYSINNTARNVLWLPVHSAVKLKGKPTIDSLFARIGDGFAALTVLVGVQFLALATEVFFVFNVGLVVIWLFLSFGIIRGHRALVEEAARETGA